MTSESLYLCSSGGNRGPEVDVCGRPAPFIHFRFYIKKKLTGKNEIASLTLRPSLEYRARWYRRNAASLRRPNARRSDPSVRQSSIDLACCNSGYDPIKDSFMEHILLCLHRFWLDSLEWQGLSFQPAAWNSQAQDELHIRPIFFTCYLFLRWLFAF